jgi:pimeloyl-ACP methyl ester carboxylesterase
MKSTTVRHAALAAAAGFGATVIVAAIQAGLLQGATRPSVSAWRGSALREPTKASVALPPVRLRQVGLGRQNLVRVWTVHYNASDRTARVAFLVLPRWYGPRNNPPIPLVISPHGRGIEPQTNARFWGNLPALGSFAVVNPEGQGHRLELISWGAPSQIADLSRMSQIVTDALPWLRIASNRIYAVGSSMGGQETLLLLAKYPRLLAGAAALDAPTNLAARYHAFRQLPYGIGLQQLARLEFGGTPLRRRDAYADRSPLFYARQIARSGVPLQIWWSTRDQIVVNQAGESGLLYRAIKRLNPGAPVSQVVGTWAHSAEFKAFRSLPIVLARLGLIQLVGA